MFLGKVVGTVWSTKKTPDLEGIRFLVVHPYDLDKEPREISWLLPTGWALAPARW